jgi:outer membrane protein TolC
MVTARVLFTLTIVAGAMGQPVAAHGQLTALAELTVDEIVGRAVAENPELQAARAEVDAAVGRLRQAGLRPNPELEVGGQKAP